MNRLFLIDHPPGGQVYPLGHIMGGLISGEQSEISRSRGPTRAHQYRVITFNYDRVIEQAQDFLNRCFRWSVTTPAPSVELAKLHGDIKTGIIPPTWRKDPGQAKQVKEAWETATQWLLQAEEIRFLGYSLPSTDVYVKYLIGTAMVHIRNLQRVDVICLDKDGTVRERYDKLFNFQNFRFKSGDIGDYLRSCGQVRDQWTDDTYEGDSPHIEGKHEEFMSSE